MNYREIHYSIVEQLLNLYPQVEASEIAYRLLEAYYKMGKIGIALSTCNDVEIIPELTIAIERLQRGEPLQYVLGYADFFDLQFKVSDAVLIPRPETEELVAYAIDHINSVDSKILDIGTGSGCIPISIKKNKQQSQMSACDISLDALKIAQSNARHHNVTIDFFHCDILREELFSMYDVIISNPPYICPSEKKAMRTNVLDYEPHLALFVTEDDPLVFYKRIANLALKHLNNNGLLLFEINENYGKELLSTLKRKGFDETELLQDIFGRDRMIKAVFKIK